MNINPKEFVSALQSISDLDKRNKAFDKLSDVKKRREIAFDCLQLTLAGKLHGSDGCYWGGGLHWANNESPQNNTKDAKEFQKILAFDLPEYCEVCARGGMMLSQIRLGNSVTPNDMTCDNGSEHNIKGFSITSFEYMESEYEDCSHNHPYETQTTKKLQNICLNVIANGDFKLGDNTDYLVDYMKK